MVKAYANKRCRLCDTEFVSKGPRTFFCENCRSIKRKEWNQKYDKSERAKIKRRERDKGEVAKARYARYRNTKKYREYARNRYYQMDENKRKARYTARNGLRSGKIIKAEACENCQEKGRLEMHHHKGYVPEHWLNILWLCTSCHKKADK